LSPRMQSGERKELACANISCSWPRVCWRAPWNDERR
jgi:hypothetical protein